MQRYHLRRETLDDVIEGVAPTSLPIMFTGTVEECKEWASAHGWEWVKVDTLLTGGCWTKEQNLTLMPTLAG